MTTEGKNVKAAVIMEEEEEKKTTKFNSAHFHEYLYLNLKQHQQ